MTTPAADSIEPEDMYGLLARELNTPANRAEAARQWSQIPTDTAVLKAWMRGEPINGVKS